VTKLAVALAVCGSFLCSQAQAKTFVGVLWPMFGPLPAVGLVELVAELKRMPDVEVETYVHQAWPSLVEDLKRLPPGTHTVVVGYSLGANSSVFVANNSKYIDTIIALQPSLLSWNPAVTGKVGRYIEIYNPNPWETLGGMGSRKLIGPNIEYIANNDSHPGAQFDPQFRNLVKSEVAKFIGEDRVETAQAETPKPVEVAAAYSGQIIDLPRDGVAKDRADAAPARRPAEVASVREGAASASAQAAPAQTPPARQQEPAQLENVAYEAAAPQQEQPSPQQPTPQQPTLQQPTLQQPTLQQPRQWTAFLDTLTISVDSGDLLAERQLTRADMVDYAKRTYGPSHSVGLFPGRRHEAAGGMITTASVAFDRTALAGQ
jgi:hypothetical protein